MNAQKSTALYSALQVRELDRRAIEEHEIPAYTLMQRAAEAAYALIQDKWPQARQLLLLCGAGNNGGDALVIARLALAAGQQEQVVMLCEPAHLMGAAQQAWLDYEAAGGQVLSAAAMDFERLLAEADLVVDGLLGTGLSRPVTGQYKEVIGRLAEASDAGLPVLALDIPSGLNSNTGAVMGVAVKATATMSFIGEKVGLYTGSAADYVGEVAFNDLAVPAGIYREMTPQAFRIDDALRVEMLSPRQRTAHKGHNGRALCVGGDNGTSGAIRLAAEATLRCGAGLVTVATRPETASVMAQARPELMAKGVTSAEELPVLLDGKNAVLIGPGLGQAEWGKDLLSAAMAAQCPMIVDADALNLLAGSGIQRDDWVLTPHPGEAASLLGCSSADIQADRPAAVEGLLAQYGGTVVLKGPGTLIKQAGGDLYVCTAGNPGMAVGGMGDVLAGLITGLVAQGLELGIAARLAVYLHARAADEAAAALGERGLLPSDLWPWLRQLINPAVR